MATQHKTPSTAATTERKAADGFINFRGGVLGSIAIHFTDDEDKQLWELIRSFSPSDQRAYLIHLIEMQDVNIYLAHQDATAKSEHVANVMKEALAKMQAA